MTAVAEMLARTATRTSGQGEHRFLLHNISWKTYDSLCKDLDGQRVRINYDCGSLEFMTVSRLHEKYRWCLGRLFEMLCDAFRVQYEVGGSMTFRDEDLKKGMEPDDCYWTDNAHLMRGKTEPDLATDPPPDVVLEVEVTHGLVNRLAILAALRIPQVWHFDTQALRAGLLQPDGTYHWQDTSPTFPGLALSDLVPFLKQMDTRLPQEVLLAFRAWLDNYMASAKKPRRKRP